MRAIEILEAPGHGERMSGHRWSPAEIEILRQGWRPGRNNSALATQLDRSLRSMKNKAGCLGLSEPARFRFWTPREDEQLREMIGWLPARKIAKRIGRSEVAVHARSLRLGLSWDDRNGWYTARDVSEILGMDPHWVRKRIGDGTLAASPAGGGEPGWDAPYAWRIERRDLRSFLRRHPHELTGRNVDIVQVVEILAGLDHGSCGE